MDVSKLKIEIVETMPKNVMNMFLRVTETAKKLAEKLCRFQLRKQSKRHLFHDIAKFMDKAELHQILERRKRRFTAFSFHHELWHAPVGAMIARDEFGDFRCGYFECNPISYDRTGRYVHARKAHLCRRYD